MTRSLAIGDRGPACQIGPITRTDFVRYAGAAGDFNPLHHDDEYARRAGNPSVFAHGMFSASLLASQLVQWFGPDRTRGFKVRFNARVWPGDTVSVEAKLVSFERDGEETMARVELQLLRQTGEVAVTGEALMLCPPGQPGAEPEQVR